MGQSLMGAEASSNEGFGGASFRASGAFFIALGVRDRQAINDAEGARRPGSPPRKHNARDVERRN
jgi:hypothetical protein